ncbi:MAG: VCBS repeat-containing protein [Myxococcales bacterium]|nr:VCBS repeat-containing protein [Myxococcales bacterium]
MFRLALATCLAGAPLVLALSCGGDSNEVAGGGFGGGGAVGGTSGTGGGSNEGGIDTGTGGAAQCGPGNPCESGVCVNGVCCSSADKACGGACCTGSDICLFDQCVTPGKTCQSQADCDPGQYCETALGENPEGGVSDAGAVDAGGKVCTAPVPPNGRCLDLPPICAGDGGVPDAGACIEKCEYFPPAGNLTPVKKWQWGQEKVPPQNAGKIDVWATPAVGRLYDANCDGQVDESDSPSIVFVSGNSKGTCCHCTGDTVSACQNGVLRAVDGKTGDTLWTLAKAEAGSNGFAAGISVALGDIDGDQRMDVVAMTGEGKIAVIDGDGKVLGVSDKPHPTGTASASFGWGGGLALGDMDNDGHPEIAYAGSVWTTNGNTITYLFTGAAGGGGGNNQALSFFADLDEDGKLELVAGNAAYEKDGSMLWQAPSGVPNGFNAVADLDGDQKPEVVVSSGGKVWVLEGADGKVELGPVTLPGTGSGPPTVADFDGDKKPEIGIAERDKYAMVKPNYVTGKLDVMWSAPNHDLSSSVTGSSVFDFEGDGKAEVVYADECFLWVYDGTTGAVRLATNTTSFTATEASLVADVDGDGHSEIVMVSNGADPSAGGWGCDVAPWNKDDPANNRPAWKPPAGATAYRGITVFGDKENSWVGTRTLWNQHAYSVSNVCDSRDSACVAPNVYGSIPANQQDNWKLPWLNNFRQNVQDKGIFDAPDATVSISVDCTNPVVVHVSVRNIGLAGLPAGVTVGVFVNKGGTESQLGTVQTTKVLLAGQTEVIDFTVPGGSATNADTFFGRILIDPNNKTFNECRDDNNQSASVTATCGPA